MSAPQCPICNKAILRTVSPGILTCDYCHARIVRGQLRCRACQTLNPIGTESCSNCGEPLTIVSQVISRQGSPSKSQRLEQMRSRAGAIQEEARVSSDARMAEFMEVDRRRIEGEHEALLAQQEHDRRLFRNLAIGMGVFFLLIAAATLVILF